MNTNDLLELIEKRPDVTLHIKGGELLELANHLIETTKKQLEQIITDANTETYPNRQKVAELLDVDLSTLHRWSKTNYLVPIEIGGKRRYRMSDVKRILEGK